MASSLDHNSAMWVLPLSRWASSITQPAPDPSQCPDSPCERSRRGRRPASSHGDDRRGSPSRGPAPVAGKRPTLAHEPIVEESDQNRKADGERNHQAGPEETHRVAGLLAVLRGAGRPMDGIDRHARGPSAINSRQIDTASQRTITSGTHMRAVTSLAPNGRTRRTHLPPMLPARTILASSRGGES